MRPQTKRRGTIAAVAIALLAAGAAGCGGDSTVGGGGAQAADRPVAKGGDASGTLTISNWPGYVDPGKNGTLREFEQESGIKVEYIEDINSNTGFFGKLQPQLERGEPGDRSIFVVTGYMARQMWDLGYLQELDHAELPLVFENLASNLRTPVLDPDRRYSIPWQGGMTGLSVNTKEAPDVRSVDDLFDPKYKGRVSLTEDIHETPALVMKAAGIDAAEATPQQWLAAIEKIKSAADSGQIRAFTTNDYTEEMTSGNTIAAIGYSGDGSLIANDDVEWRMPEEGCMLWSDDMVIPVGAPNTAAAYEFMNFVYQPEVQADIAAFVDYLTPVEGVRQVLAERTPSSPRTTSSSRMTSSPPTAQHRSAHRATPMRDARSKRRGLTSCPDSRHGPSATSRLQIQVAPDHWCTASTCPARSAPSPLLLGRERPAFTRTTYGLPRRLCRSSALTEAARTRTSTSSSPTTGISTSSNGRTSGDP